MKLNSIRKTKRSDGSRRSEITKDGSATELSQKLEAELEQKSNELGQKSTSCDH
jgi:hypothetical protein